MSQIAEIRKAATELTRDEKAELAVFLLEAIEIDPHFVDDEEVQRRSAELDSGVVEGLSREEFTRLCGH